MIVYNDPFQTHEQRIGEGGGLLFCYAKSTLIVQETVLICCKEPYLLELPIIKNRRIFKFHLRIEMGFFIPIKVEV
jgi:hypothetical protein